MRQAVVGDYLLESTQKVELLISATDVSLLSASCRLYVTARTCERRLYDSKQQPDTYQLATTLPSL